LEVQRSFNLLNEKIGTVKQTESSSLYALGLMGRSYGSGPETIVMPERRKERRIRFTLDYEEDYWFLSTLINAGVDYRTSREKIEETAQFPLHWINWFRNESWKANQLAESRH